jgi:hypothetical protein
MKLTELDPKWLTPDLFVFRNPTGGSDWLSCKRVVMSIRDQMELFAAQGFNWNVVPMAADFCWAIEGDFETMTVRPSIDASASGNWHGWIRGGETL